MKKEGVQRKPVSRDDRIFDAVVLTVLFLLMLCFILPFMNIISLSISDQYAIMRGDVHFLPKGFNLASYEKLLHTNVVLHSYGNTIFIAATGCVLSLLMTALAAYPLVFAQFRLQKLYSIFIMFTMWFSGGMVPTYIVMSRYGLVDNMWVLILNSLISAYHVLVLKSFYASIPQSLVESAKIDGANDFRILFQIVIPLSKAALATIALWVVVLHWNDYLNALVYMRSTENYTLQLIMREMGLSSEVSSMFDVANLDRSAISDQLKNAVVVFVMAPMILIYPFFQKYFVKGVMVGAVKG